MARARKMTDAGVARLAPRAKRYTKPDPELRGHYIRVQPSGAKSYVAVARNPGGKQIWATIGGTDLFTVDEAREKAREAIKRITVGKPPFPRPDLPATFEDVADTYLRRHVDRRGLRSAHEIRRLLNQNILPRWRDRDFLRIKRTDVTSLLDHIEDAHGPRQADYCLSIIRQISNWYATRHDDYVPPLVPGMRRTDPKERSRKRILDDDEIRAVWNATEANGTFGAIIRLLLLTGQRRRKVQCMRWDDVSIDGAWDIPSEEREKGSGGLLVLPEIAVDVVRSQPRVGQNPYVFAGRGRGPFNGFSKAKREFDERLTDVSPWVLHDLRRTARSLMSRAGVRPDIAERVLGHAIPGVAGVYDRHAYKDEKADALRRLAELVAEITKPDVYSTRPSADVTDAELSTAREAGQ